MASSFLYGVHRYEIYGWGMPSAPSFWGEQIVQDVTPAIQTQLAWAYIGINAILAITSTLISDKKGQVLLAVTGAGFLAYALVAIFVVISGRLEALNIPLQGSTQFMSTLGSAFLVSKITSGFYLACVSGPLLIILALFRNIIMSRK